MSELIQLPGVGRKTANVVLSNGYGINVGIVVDTHVKRISTLLKLTTSSDPTTIENDLIALFPKKDWGILLITMAPFITGLLARYQVGDYSFWITAHVLTGEIVLLAIPFTKLSHVFLFFASRAQLGMDFGIKRGGLRGTKMAW